MATTQKHKRSGSHTTPSLAPPRLVALAGNPNVGKTTLFNQLTGLRQKVGNYPGVTVERKLGRINRPGGGHTEIVDVPGTYSLNPRSLDEEIAYRVLVGEMNGQGHPDLIVCVADATNLERNLYLTSQVIDLGVPTILALNMTDAAEAEGIEVDVDQLSLELGIPVIPIAASHGKGVSQLKAALLSPPPAAPRRRWHLPEAMETTVTKLAQSMSQDETRLDEHVYFADALRALANSTASRFENHHPPHFWREVDAARDDLREQGVLYEQAEVIARYAWITPIAQRVVSEPDGERRNLTERLDAVLTHRVAGPLIFLGILGVIFQAVFSWAGPFMDAIDAGVGKLGELVASGLPEGLLRSMIVDGAIAGVGGIVIFLPQILFLFFLLGLLEDTGYMARAAFLMDRVMKKVGLSGRSVVPLISSYACAIPGVMATRTMDNQRDRLVTMMVAPLMQCSARLPVYALLIAAFVPATRFGPFGYQALTLLGLYVLGTITAIVAAWILRRRVITGDETLFVMELPAYRRPRMRDVLWRMWERGRLFLTRAGTIILAISIVLWFLATFPRSEPSAELVAERAAVEQAHSQVLVAAEVVGGPGIEERVAEYESAYEERLGELDDAVAAEQLQRSFIGRMGQAIEPIMRPLGFDWKIDIALISAFAAREVAVSALGTIYSVGDADETNASLKTRMIDDIDPRTGKPVWTPLVALSLMIFFVFAMQCMSTLAVVRRETNTWRWPLFMLVYMTGMAYVASLIVYQGGRLLGYT